VSEQVVGHEVRDFGFKRASEGGDELRGACGCALGGVAVGI